MANLPLNVNAGECRMQPVAMHLQILPVAPNRVWWKCVRGLPREQMIGAVTSRVKVGTIPDGWVFDENG